jgi:hypothetical protein
MAGPGWAEKSDVFAKHDRSLGCWLFSDYVHSRSQVTLEGFHFPSWVSRQCRYSMSLSQHLMPTNRASSRHFQ